MVTEPTNDLLKLRLFAAPAAACCLVLTLRTNSAQNFLVLAASVLFLAWNGIWNLFRSLLRLR